MTFLCFQKVVPPIVNTQHRNARCRLYLLYLFKMYNVHTVLFRDSLVKVTQIQHVLIRAPLQVNTIIVQCTVITTSFVSVKGCCAIFSIVIATNKFCICRRVSGKESHQNRISCCGLFFLHQDRFR